MISKHILWKGKNRDLLILYALAVIGSVIAIMRFCVLYYPDTQSYIDAWDYNLSNGRIDAWRTPVYPYLIGLMKLIFGRYFGMGIVGIQYIVFLLSIKCFYQMTMDLIGLRKLAFVLTLIYVFPFMMWNNVIQTESLAFSSSTFIAYSVFKLREGFSIKVFSIFALMSALIIFLRPSSVYLLPVLFVWWIFVAFKEKLYKTALCCVGYIMVITMCLFGYMKTFEREYGLFTPTNVSLLNQLYIVFDRDIINTDLIEDENLKEDVQICVERFKLPYGSYAAIDYLFQRYDKKELNDMVMEQYKSQSMKSVIRTFEYISKTKRYQLFIANYPNLAIVLDIMGVNVGSFYLFVILYTIFLLLWIICNKMIPPKTTLLYAMAIANLIVVIIGAQNDWMRLIQVSFPMYLLIFGQFCTLFSQMIPIRKIRLC